MKKMSACFLFLPIIALAAMWVNVSCGKLRTVPHNFHYTVTNQTDFQIKVIFNDLLGPSGSSYLNVQDSVIYLEPGEEKILFMATWFRGQDNPESGTRIKGMKTLRVYKNDSILSVTDFMLTSCWTFRESSTSVSEYNLPVNPADFKP